LSSSGNIKSQPIENIKLPSPQIETKPAPKPKPVESETVASAPKEQFIHKQEIKTPTVDIDDEISLPEPPPEKAMAQNVETVQPANYANIDPQTKSITLEIWHEILEDIEKTNPFFVDSLEGASLLGEENNILKISVLAPDKMRLNQLEKTSNKKQLEEKIHQKCGKKLSVKFEIQSSSQSNEDEDTVDEPEQEQVSRGELMERLEKNKNFLLLQEKLPGKILRIR
jgi:hypothetical protein